MLFLNTQISRSMWEEKFQNWAKAPSQTEQEKCDNAVRAVRKAIESSDVLQYKNVEIFAQGSYRNRTNVKEDSDVDICILLKDVCFTDFSMSEGLTCSDVGLSDASYIYADYKIDIEKALCKHFGDGNVNRSNKAFDIHENTNRVDADVVACFEHRRYMRTSDGGYK